MDWQTILTATVTSFFSSSLITAGVIFFVKKSIDRAIDLRYEKLLEEAKLQAQESLRRKAALHDQQSKVLQELVSHVHHLRRLAKDMWKLISTEKPDTKRWKEFDQARNEFEKRTQGFREFISNNRVLLTRQHLAVQHDITSLTSNIQLHSKLRKLDRANMENSTSGIQSSLERLDEGYTTMLYLAQIQLGILDDSENE
ncbi:MAG: hypothetical protein IT314_14075 [Anaerolineales bacterium]|nr:hypothetical protein [Anaerolineales bacterium]